LLSAENSSRTEEGKLLKESNVGWEPLLQLFNKFEEEGPGPISDLVNPLGFLVT
jgi:hypothetical protein